MSVTGSRISDIRFYWHTISFLNTATGQDFKSKRYHCSHPRRRSRWEFNRSACTRFRSATRVATTHPERINRSHPLTTRYSECLMFSVYVVVQTVSTIRTNRMHYLLSIYFSNWPLHVSSRLNAHHQQVFLCIYSSWYMLCSKSWNLCKIT
jgi:hypothetical protein